MTRSPIAIVTDRGEVVSFDVLDRFAVKEAPGSQQIVTQATFAGEQGQGLIAPRYDPAHLNSLLEANTAHYAACRQKSQDTAGSGWRFDKVDDRADDKDRALLMEFFDERITPASALDDDDPPNVFEAAAFDFEATGRGVLELVREGDTDGPAADGRLATIVHMPAHTVRVHRDGIRFQQARGGVRRWFRWAGATTFDVNRHNGELAPAGSLPNKDRASEVIWWRNHHPNDLVYGCPDIIPAIGAAVGDLARRDFNLQFFANWGVPAYMVTISGDFDPGPPVDLAGNPDPNGRSAIEWQVEKHFATMRDRPWSTLVLTVPTSGTGDGEKVEVKIEPLATDVKEASFRMYRRDNREEVLSAHRMSAAVAGVFDAGAANREAISTYKRTVVLPRQRRLERLVNQHIVRGAFGVTGWRWRLNAPDTRDLAAELEQLKDLVAMGAATPGEVRAHFADTYGLTADMPTPPPVPRDDRAVTAALRSLADDLVAIALKEHR